MIRKQTLHILREKPWKNIMMFIEDKMEHKAIESQAGGQQQADMLSNKRQKKSAGKYSERLQMSQDLIVVFTNCETFEKRTFRVTRETIDDLMVR